MPFSYLELKEQKKRNIKAKGTDRPKGHPPSITARACGRSICFLTAYGLFIQFLGKEEFNITESQKKIEEH